MRSSLILFFSILVTLAIVTPSVVSLFKLGNDTAVLIDFNEEEHKQEEKKEIDEHLICLSDPFSLSASHTEEPSNFTKIFSKGYSANSIAIFLPPPEFVN